MRDRLMPPGHGIIRKAPRPSVDRIIPVPDTNTARWTPTVRWTPDRAEHPPPWPLPPLLTAIRRGVLCRCPACGQSKLFRGYLRVAEMCPDCGAPLGLVRADDAPPYFTMLLVGHLVVPSMLVLERTCAPPLWVHFIIWLPLAAALTLLLLRPVKGGTVGLMLKLGLLKSDDEA